MVTSFSFLPLDFYLERIRSVSLRSGVFLRLRTIAYSRRAIRAEMALRADSVEPSLLDCFVVVVGGVAIGAIPDWETKAAVLVLLLFIYIRLGLVNNMNWLKNNPDVSARAGERRLEAIRKKLEDPYIFKSDAELLRNDGKKPAAALDKDKKEK